MATSQGSLREVSLEIADKNRRYGLTLKPDPDQQVAVELLNNDPMGERCGYLHGLVYARDLTLVAELLTVAAASVVSIPQAAKPMDRRGGSQEIKAPPAYRVEDLRRIHPNSHKRWTPEEEARLAELHAEGATAEAIGEALGRNRNGITARLERLGLIEPGA